MDQEPIDLLKHFERFHSRLDMRLRNDPHSTIMNAAFAWLEVSKCDWCWIWIYNDKTRRYEVAGTTVKRSSGFSKLKPERSQAETLYSAVQWAGMENELTVIRSNEFDGWHRESRGKDYKLTSVDWFKGKKCKEIRYIPFDSSGDKTIDYYSDETSQELVKGVVGLYTREENENLIAQIPEAFARSMADSTGSAIYVSQLLLKQKVLRELAEVLSTHTTGFKEGLSVMQSENVLRKLSDDICERLKQTLKLEGVSIFYRNRENTGVRCIGTTGLWDEQKNEELNADDIEGAFYQVGEGRTGQCFLSGKISDFPNAHKLGERPKYREYCNYSCDDEIQPRSMMVPVGPPATPNVRKTPRTSGIIRVLQNCNLWDDDKIAGVEAAASWRRFDSMAEKLLQDASYLVASAVGAQQRRIWRERDINVADHAIKDLSKMVKKAVDIREEWRGLNPSPQQLHLIAAVELSLFSVFVLEKMLGRLKKDYSVHELGYFDLSNNIEVHLLPAIQSLATLKGKEVSVKIEPNDRGFQTWGDWKAVSEIIWELVHNACKYSFDSNSKDKFKAIELRISYIEGRSEVIVSNFGEAIPDTKASEVFKRYVRVNLRGAGTGIGLYAAQQLAEKMNGNIDLVSKSAPISFKLTLPNRLASDDFKTTMISPALHNRLIQ